MTCSIILSRSRPPPRGPLRSSAGRRAGDAVEHVPRRLDEARRGARRPRASTGVAVGFGDDATGPRSRSRRRPRAGSTTSRSTPCGSNRSPALPRPRRSAAAARAAPRSPGPRSSRRATGRASRARTTKIFLGAPRRKAKRSAHAPHLRRIPVRACPECAPRSAGRRPEPCDERRRAPRHRGRRRRGRRRARDATMTPSAPAFAIARTWAGLLTPNPTATGTGEAAFTSRTSAGDRRRERRPGAGHADERDAVQEPAAAGGDLGAACRRRGRGDEVDDGEPGVARRPPRTARPRRASGPRR